MAAITRAARLSPVPSIRKDGEFRRIYRKGHSYAVPSLVLYIMRRASKPRMLKDPHSPRFGVSVSAKVGNAVVRNRIRRQVKEFFRINPPLLKPDCDYVVVARAEAAGATFALLSRELRFMLSRLDKRTAPAQPRAAAPRATAPHGYATQPHAEGKT